MHLRYHQLFKETIILFKLHVAVSAGDCEYGLFLQWLFCTKCMQID